MVQSVFGQRPNKDTNNCLYITSYLQMRSRSIIFLVFLDAIKMNSQGTVIMRKVARTTKVADVRSTGFAPMRNLKTLLSTG